MSGESYQRTQFDDVIDLAMMPAIQRHADALYWRGKSVSVVRQARPKGVGLVVAKLEPVSMRFEPAFSFILFEETADPAFVKVTSKTPRTEQPQSDEYRPSADAASQLVANFVANL